MTVTSPPPPAALSLCGCIRAVGGPFSSPFGDSGRHRSVRFGSSTAHRQWLFLGLVQTVSRFVRIFLVCPHQDCDVVEDRLTLTAIAWKTSLEGGGGENMQLSLERQQNLINK